MIGKIGKLGILVVWTAVALLAVGLLVLSYSEVGLATPVGNGGRILVDYNLSDVPQLVTEDAVELAEELFGDNQEKYVDFVDQLLASYMEAEDKDFVVLFNSGGWGWNLLDKTPGWHSILKGIESELDNLGYTAVLLNYRRTSETLWGCIEEFVEVTAKYPSKAEGLARRVEFITAHIPEVRIIIAGESNGTLISDSTMKLLQDNSQVYSIQTGIPFWHKPVMLERTLVVNSNGTAPDSFSDGDIPTMLRVNFGDWLGVSQSEENPGTILSWLRAPGHDYSWQYPEVYSRIVEFLETSFGVKQRQVIGLGG
ncbi:hypothetical protein ACFLWZ_04870 [Chloroflexota bacterium]